MAVVKLQSSSSFRLAIFFSILLVCSVGIVAYLITIANSTDFAHLTIQEIRDTINVLGISMIILMFIVLAVAYFVSVYVVNLINTITETADDIMKSGDLSQRIPLTHDRDDLSKMARVLNSMFDRIEELVTGVRQVSDNIAHDLRTPLSRLRNKLEKFDGTEEEKAELLNEADNLINIFNALLRIARIESAKETVQLEPVDMKQLLEDVIDLYEPLAQEKQQVLQLSINDAEIIGDKHLIFQAVANLLDNAIKFTPNKGQVGMSMSVSEEFVSIIISDSGEGIAKEDRERIFNRFFRAEASRNQAGHGLGLSLVKAVADAHGGSVEILDSEIGLEIVLNLSIKK